MTGPEHRYMQVLWLIQWAMDLLSCTGAAVINQLAQGTCEGTLPCAVVILRSQAEVQSCAGYDYIPHRVPMKSGSGGHHWVKP